MALDSFLSLGTLLFWYWETEGPSFVALLKEFLALIWECRGLRAGGSIMTTVILGVIQVIFWYILAVRPDFAQIFFQLDRFEGFASGYLSAIFFLISIYGLYHVLCPNNVNRCLSPVSICYRVLVLTDAPVLLVLFLVDQIERNLFLALLIINLFVAVILLLSIVSEHGKISQTTQPLNRTVMDFCQDDSPL